MFDTGQVSAGQAGRRMCIWGARKFVLGVCPNTVLVAAGVGGGEGPARRTHGVQRAGMRAPTLAVPTPGVLCAAPASLPPPWGSRSVVPVPVPGPTPPTPKFPPRPRPHAPHTPWHPLASCRDPTLKPPNPRSSSRPAPTYGAGVPGPVPAVQQPGAPAGALLRLPGRAGKAGHGRRGAGRACVVPAPQGLGAPPTVKRSCPSSD